MSPRKRNPFWYVVVIALGFCGYGASNWLQVEEPSEEVLEASVEANYQIDIARMRSQQADRKLELSPEWKKKHRQAIRNEILAEIQHEKDLAQSWFFVGLALLVFSLGRIIAAPFFAPRDPQ